MKLTNMILVTGLFVTLLSGCKDDNRNRAAAGARENGSVVGNGLISYSNETLNINFEYPKEWTLQESANKEEVSLSNASIVKGDLPSTIEFRRLKELNGKRIFSQKELKDALVAMFPNENWTASEFVGHRNGFVARELSASKKGTQAKYYILDENYNILFVSYSAAPDFGGEDIIYAVIGSVVIDLDPPEVLEISVSPTEAKPGDQVTVTILAVDDASGIDSAYFHPPTVDLTDFKQSWFGYDLKHFPYDIIYPHTYDQPEAPWMTEVSAGLRKAYEPAAAFPFTSPWQRITKVRFKYSFVVPKNAPNGKVVLANMYLRDSRGNSLNLTLEPATKYEDREQQSSYMANYQVRRVFVAGKVNRQATELKAIGFIVSGSQTQKAELEIRDLFWDNSLRGESWGSRNDLLVRLQSENKVVAALFDSPTIAGNNCDVNMDYFFDERLNSEDGDYHNVSYRYDNYELLRLSRTIHWYNSYPCSSETSSTTFVRRLYLRDEVGHLISLAQASPDSHEAGDLSLPALGKAVLFQAAW